MDNQLFKYALAYAQLGWAIFPCRPGEKTPLTPHGVKDATRDESQIQAWWDRWPNANLAVACGEPSGVYVVDVDVSEKANGWSSLNGYEIPKTVRQDTPSGGAHFFFRTDNPPANKNSFLPGIDIRGTGYYVVLTPSLHPNGQRYTWSNDLSPWDIQSAEFPALFRPKTKPNVQQQASALPINADSNILRRASMYLATCDPAIQGAGGHDKLLWAATILVHGFLLSDADAYSLLVNEYNPRCVPSWDLGDPKDEKDFRRKVSEARRLGSHFQAGWLLDDPAYNSLEVTQETKDAARRLIENAEKAIQSYASTNIDDFLSPPGLLGEICEWIDSTAIKTQPMLTLGCVLAFCGVLFGRKVRDTGGTRTNLYCMGIADSTAGKNHAPNQIRRLCLEAGALDLLGGDDFASDSSIEARLEKNPATLFLCDEIGHLFAAIKSGLNQHTAKVISLLMKLYSTAGSVYSGREYADTDKRRTLIQPCCCIYGYSTLERFLEGLSPDELTDGWLSRCLVFHTVNNPDKTRNLIEAPVPHDLARKVNAWFGRQISRSAGDGNMDAFVNHYTTGIYARPPNQIIVPTQAEAETLFREFDNDCGKLGKKDKEIATLWYRAEENARRIALIIATSMDFHNPEVTPAIAVYSIALIRYLLKCFCEMVPWISTSIVDKKKHRVCAVIESTGVNGCSRREIARRTQYLARRERDEILLDLAEAGRIITEMISGGVRYWTTRNRAEFERGRL